MSEKLRELDRYLPNMDQRIDVMMGPVTVVDDLINLRNALPELIAVVEAAEAIDKSYVDLGAVSANLGDLLEALKEKLQ